MLRCVDVSWATWNVAGKIVSQLNCKAVTSLYESVFPMGVSKRSGSHSDYTDTHSILFWLKHASSIIIHHHWLRSCFDQSYRHVKWRSFSFHWFSQVKICCYCMLLSEGSRIEQFAPKFWGFLCKHLDERFLAAPVCPFFKVPQVTTPRLCHGFANDLLVIAMLHAGLVDLIFGGPQLCSHVSFSQQDQATLIGYILWILLEEVLGIDTEIFSDIRTLPGWTRSRSKHEHLFHALTGCTDEFGLFSTNSSSCVYDGMVHAAIASKLSQTRDSEWELYLELQAQRLGGLIES